MISDKIWSIRIKHFIWNKTPSEKRLSKICRNDSYLGILFVTFTDHFKAHYNYCNSIDIQFTQKTEDAVDYVEKDYSVFFCGSPGEGKTTTAFNITKQLVDKGIVNLDRCVLIHDPDDLKDILFDMVDILFIDDIFGKHNTEVSKLRAWHILFPTLDIIVRTRKVRVIFASRMHIYLECKHELDGYDMFSRTVELSSVELTEEEKKNILVSQLKANSRALTEVDINACISQHDSNIGFPLCAHQFASDDNLFAKGVEYFTKPYKYYLEQNIQNLDEQARISLRYVFFKFNSLRNCDIDITKIDEMSKRKLQHVALLCGVDKPIVTLLKETKQKISSLQGTYLKNSNNIISFRHSTIYETVALLLGKEYPAEVIQHCTVEYFCQCIRVQNVDNEGEVVVNQNEFIPLAERCINEIIKYKRGQRLSSHPIFMNKGFVKVFFKVVSEQDEIFREVFQTDVSVKYSGIHAFLYHIVTNQKENDVFLREALSYLKCEHDDRSNVSCWKCLVKSEVLAGACGANRQNLYTELRNERVRVTSLCLYKAVENQINSSEFVEEILKDLQKTEEYAVNIRNLQFCLGMSMKHHDKRILNILKNSGFRNSVRSLYFLVQTGDTKLLSEEIDTLKQTNTWLPDSFPVSRALLKAKLSDNKDMLDTLYSAGAKLTEAGVYWATLEHGYEDVKHIFRMLKQANALDTESHYLGEAFAIALKCDDARILDFLKQEGIVPMTSTILTMTEQGNSAEEIQSIIVELKCGQRWNTEDEFLASAYIAACERPDKNLRELFTKEGVGISPGCLPYVIKWFRWKIVMVIKTLKHLGQLDPRNKFIATAYVWAIQYEDEFIIQKLKNEGLYVTMACVFAAAEPRFTAVTLKGVVNALKTEKRWNPSHDFALRALNLANKRQDKAAYNRLLHAGVRWLPRNLYLAVQFETLHGLKQAITQLKSRSLIRTEDVSNALSLAVTLKDHRKIILLKEAGLTDTDIKNMQTHRHSVFEKQLDIVMLVVIILSCMVYLVLFEI